MIYSIYFVSNSVLNLCVTKLLNIYLVKKWSASR